LGDKGGGVCVSTDFVLGSYGLFDASNINSVWQPLKPGSFQGHICFLIFITSGVVYFYIFFQSHLVDPQEEIKNGILHRKSLSYISTILDSLRFSSH